MWPIVARLSDSERWEDEIGEGKKGQKTKHSIGKEHTIHA
jgi:hypothetical protein